jgi:hypothetical protein
MGRWRREGKPCRNGRGYAKSEGGGGDVYKKVRYFCLPAKISQLVILLQSAV